MSQLVEVYQNDGNLKRASVHMEQLHAMHIHMGPASAGARKSLQKASTLNDLGIMRLRMGELDRSRALLTEAFEVRKGQWDSGTV
eukprot:2411607-Pyramimonas_sp.AAC.1